MSLLFTNEWFTCKNAISKKDCNRIIKLAQGNWGDAKVALGTVSKQLEEGKWETDENKRICDVFFTSEQWVYDLLWPFMWEANERAGWKLDISSVEAMQITRYKKGGHYTWHIDGTADSLSGYDTPTNPFMHGKVRKISMSLILNNDYEGGEFELGRVWSEVSGHKNEECDITPVELNAGDMVFFHSGLEHRVLPVTKGVRYSLVVWFLGPPVR